MRVVIAHTPEHMAAALEAAESLKVPLTLQSPPDAIFYAGAAYLLRMFEQAKSQFSNTNVRFILDCADAGAEAISAMQLGHRDIRSTAPQALRAKLADIAAKHGVQVHSNPYEALDLRSTGDTKDACIKWLKGDPCK